LDHEITRTQGERNRLALSYQIFWNAHFQDATSIDGQRHWELRPDSDGSGYDGYGYDVYWVGGVDNFDAMIQEMLRLWSGLGKEV
jgi:hypothetical protein